MINLPMLDFDYQKGLINNVRDSITNPKRDTTQDIMHEHGTYKFTNKVNKLELVVDIGKLSTHIS